MLQNIHSSIICNSQNLETNQMPIDSIMEKEIVVCLKNEIVCNNEKEQAIYDIKATFHKSKLGGRSHSQKY